jgi:hypothetical protein
MRRTAASHVALVLTLALAACGGSSAPPAAEPSNAAGGGSAAEATAGDTTVYTFVSVEQADTACYVTVHDASGAEKTYPGEFDLCTHDPIPGVGAKVRIEWGTANVLAASCEGNPDCPDSDEVAIVRKLVPAE